MGEEGTSEGFADDITILFDMFEGSLRNIIRTLDGFYGTSGLQLNKNKTLNNYSSEKLNLHNHV
jgi:hypothetical protein